MKLKIWTAVFVVSLLMINGLYVVNGSTEEDSNGPLRMLKPVEKIEKPITDEYSAIHHTFNLTFDDSTPPPALNLILDYSADEILSLKVRCYRPDDLGSEGSILVYEDTSVEESYYYNLFKGINAEEIIYNQLYEYEESPGNISVNDIDPIASVFGKDDGDILSDPKILKGEYSFEMILKGKNLEVHDSKLNYRAGNFIREAEPPEEELITETVFNRSNPGYMYYEAALDREGDPHVIYSDRAAGILKYKFWDGDRWIKETVEEGPEIGSYALSIAIENDSVPHILFDKREDDHNLLKYGYKKNDSWTFQTLDQGDAVGQYPQLSISPEGNPRVFYGDYGKKTLIYGVKKDDGWTKRTLAYNVFMRGYDVAYDEGEPAHVVYRDKITYRLKYLHKEGDHWRSESLGPFTIKGENSLLEVDDEGTVYLAYGSYHPTVGGVMFAKRENENWSYEMISSKGEPSSLEFSDEGDLHLVYIKTEYDRENGSFSLVGKHLLRTDDDWKAEKIVDGSGHFGESEIDTEGNPHVFYLKHTEEKMRLNYTRIEGTKGAYRESEESDETGESGDLFTSQTWILLPVIALIAILVALFVLIKKRPQEEKRYREEEPFQDEEDRY